MKVKVNLGILLLSISLAGCGGIPNSSEVFFGEIISEDITAQLLSLASELLSLTRKSPHLGYIERDSIISQYEEEYFRLSRLVNEAFRHRNS